MSAIRIDGKLLSAKLYDELALRVARLKEKGVTPGLCVILAGEDPASQIYVRNKARACERVGVFSRVIRLPETVGEEELISTIESVNADPAFHGLLVQLPLPKGLDSRRILSRIRPDKDADGFHALNMGALVSGEAGVLPCTPRGVIEMLKAYEVPLRGARAVVVGRSNIVGKPVALLLLREDATVTICHSRTRDLKAITREADVLISAIGKPDFITADMIKPGAAVIDVGMNRRPDGKLTGDVDFAGAQEVAGWITPVPGGVGLMTVAMLIKTTVEAAEAQCPGI